jgi:hypothetical protein
LAKLIKASFRYHQDDCSTWNNCLGEKPGEDGWPVLRGANKRQFLKRGMERKEKGIADVVLPARIVPRRTMIV